MADCSVVHLQRSLTISSLSYGNSCRQSWVSKPFSILKYQGFLKSLHYGDHQFTHMHLHLPLLLRAYRVRVNVFFSVSSRTFTYRLRWGTFTRLYLYTVARSYSVLKVKLSITSVFKKTVISCKRKLCASRSDLVILNLLGFFSVFPFFNVLNIKVGT